MSLFTTLANFFSPTTTYPSVETTALDRGFDLKELKNSTSKVFVENGKVDAIRHINKTVGQGHPLPLPSTKRYVDEIENEIISSN